MVLKTLLSLSLGKQNLITWLVVEKQFCCIIQSSEIQLSYFCYATNTNKADI